MPRVASNPVGARGSRQMLASPAKPSSAKSVHTHLGSCSPNSRLDANIDLRRLSIADDGSEKAARLQSRKAMQELHLNNLQSAVSPMRKQPSNIDSPGTPRSKARRARESLTNVDQSAATPMKKIPLLANFEEWMKLATDNKINAANSWNFALIDYFHDMSLLKEGDGVNFQKASCTLDGCVKIYTSRVDSVATETGRLLSGLADSAEGKQKKQIVDEEGNIMEEEEEGDEEDEEGNRKPKRKKATRSHEATLAPSFAALQLKKLELEFAVDPLFKKASADFDEGGAKGLLLNHLSIDSEGRIVFDSSDDAGDATMKSDKTDLEAEQELEKTEEQLKEDEMRPSQEPDQEIDLDALATKFFPDLSILDQQDICPSMKGFSLDSGELPMIKAPDDWKSPLKQAQTQPLNLNLADQTGMFLDSGAAGFDDDNGLIGGFDVPENVGFGEGGEAWAKDVALEPMLRVARAEDGQNSEEAEEVDVDGYTVQLHHGYREDAQHEQILSYFSNAMQAFKPKGKGATWMGGEYWRIEKIKKAAAASGEKSTAKPRKEKEKFEIDFLTSMDESLREMLEAPAATNASITLPRAQWRTKGRNLLEVEDEPLDPALLLRLWLKPKAKVGGGGKGKRKWKMGTELTAGLFGQEGQVEKQLDQGENPDDVDERREGDYDANFFADDGQDMLPFDVPLPIDDDDDDDDGPGFTDAREMLSPPPMMGDDDVLHELPDSQQASQWPFSQADMLPGSFGSQLVTQAGRRTRPEFVNYARTAKKVDIRRLKENMWQNLGGKLLNTFQPPINGPPTPAPTEPDVDMMDVDAMDVDQPQEKPAPAEEGQVLKFTDMIGDLKASYGDIEYKDISTSYCMIVLLHLANEKGLVLQGMTEEDGMGEILVQADRTVGEGYVGE
jgi:condensin complex subunit 2